MRRLNTQYPIPNTLHKVLLIAGLFLITYSSQSQTLPVGTPVLEDYYRRMQLLGKLDSNISFTVRPLSSEALQEENIFTPMDSADDKTSEHSGIRYFANGKGRFQVLPITLQTQYNTKRPYGWNDGPMIPARGFQSVISGGVYLKYGPLSFQLRPEIVYAENKKFKEFPEEYPSPFEGGIDLPERFGAKSYNKVFPGQSSLRVSLGALSLGVSSENLWWGPGIRNSIIMSNSPPGFNHVTLNTMYPINTVIGSFEGQIIGGRLEGSGFNEKPDDWRYLSGLTFSYQPRWTPGLFLGLSRNFQIYSEDINGFSDYIPLFQSFAKENTDEEKIPRDQLASIFARWFWKEAKAEIYVEYGRGDHSVNLRDFLLEPEHSRAYTIGMRKLTPTSDFNEYLQFDIEITHLEQSINYVIRNTGLWYVHSNIHHGYTHRGEIIGAGIGSGSNLISLNIKWLKNDKSLGFEISRYVHNNEYLNTSINVNSLLKPWVDYSGTLITQWSIRNIDLFSNLRLIRSLNNYWGVDATQKNTFLNVNAKFGISYQF